MFRLSCRLLTSAHRSLFRDEKGARFLEEVTNRLAQSKGGTLEASSQLISYWQNVEEEANKFKESSKEVEQLKQLIDETTDAEFKKLAEEDYRAAEETADESAERLAEVVVPKTEMDMLKKCQLEFTAGVGGKEAMLFASDLLDMYKNYAAWRGWKWTPFQLEDISIGGIRSAVISVEGDGCFSALRFEAGVHRVQRFPLTDQSRMHTSTASVAVLPEPDEVSFILPPESVTIDAMRASGPGGQNVNKRSTAVRMVHKETGIAVHIMQERFQHMNIQIAYKRLAAILLQKKYDSADEKNTSARKLQMGSRARAEKIRTYNFKDDRITDHRIHLNMSNAEEFLRGTDHLDSLIQRLADLDKEERLRLILENCIVE
ncbi:unnamed protein product, partial [Mesorhabditis spiculigera]